MSVQHPVARQQCPARAGGIDVPVRTLHGFYDELCRASRRASGPAPIARDPAMTSVIRRAEQVASAGVSVLISGESGTGKEVIARHIHGASRAAAGPFVALNCAAIPDGLLESELFGHEKGAFSGATARRTGKFELAHGGTLLLDEISEMDLRLQAKLLRVIQEREVDRVGGKAPVSVNVRILATTNRNLADEVALGRFRSDLYFRLNVIGLRVPSLRDRPADIAPLAHHFCQRFQALNTLAARTLEHAAVRRLQAHDWPGNVRELENVVQRAVLLAGGEAIGPEAIELDDGRSAATVAPPENDLSALVGQRVDAVERDLILQTLLHTRGNRTHAATMLGISIRALRNKLHEYAAHGSRIPEPCVASPRGPSFRSPG